MTPDLVYVRRQYNDQSIAGYRIQDLSGLHWSNVSGGIQARANRAYLCGYVWCDAAVEGAVAHSCRHGEGPHHVKVCVVKKDNSKATYARLLKQLEWEARLRCCAFAVDLGDSPSPDDARAMDGWLSQHCSLGTFVRVDNGWWKPEAGWSKKGRPHGPQLWFADLQVASAFSLHFSRRFLHQQNQVKQLAAAHFMCVAEGVEEPKGETMKQESSEGTKPR
jgi:hypothetical protein